MARFRTAKPKEPKAPVVYEASPEIAEVAHRLIRLFPVQFGWTTNFKLGSRGNSEAQSRANGTAAMLAKRSPKADHKRQRKRDSRRAGRRRHGAGGSGSIWNRTHASPREGAPGGAL